MAFWVGSNSADLVHIEARAPVAYALPCPIRIFTTFAHGAGRPLTHIFLAPLLRTRYTWADEDAAGFGAGTKRVAPAPDRRHHSRVAQLIAKVPVDFAPPEGAKRRATSSPSAASSNRAVKKAK